MVDRKEQLERKEDLPSAPSSSPQTGPKSPEGLSDSRANIAGALEGGESQEGAELMDSGEKISETAGEGRERKGDGTPKKGQSQQQGDDDDQSGVAFTFDESNLPPVPKMIKQIESQLRKDIYQLEKEAKQYKGGLFRKPNYTKYSQTMIEIRKKTVSLRRVLTMAADSVKKMFLQMFGKKEGN